MDQKLNWDEIDAVNERKPYFRVGVHKVIIKDVDVDRNANDKEFLKFTVEGEGGEETDRVKRYLTEKALPWTMATIQGILVHNAKSELAKKKVTEYLHSLKTVSDLDPTRLNGAEAWLTVTESTNTFTRDDGTTGFHHDFQLTSYEPKRSNEEIADELLASGTPVEVEDVPFN